MRPTRLEHRVTADAPLDMPVRIPLRVRGAKGPEWHRHRATRFAHARLIGLRTPKGVLWLLSDMPADALPAKAAGELYRRRWQIELMFKALKSLAGLDRLNSRGPTARAWICGSSCLPRSRSAFCRPLSRVSTPPKTPMGIILPAHGRVSGSGCSP